jgi:hypothetical protein
VLDRLPDATRVCLLAFSASIAVFDLTRTDLAAALVLPADSSANEAVMNRVRDTLPQRLLPLGRCRAAAAAALGSLRCETRPDGQARTATRSHTL